MKRLIVNAHDFGLASNVSRGILESYVRGIVTSPSCSSICRGASKTQSFCGNTLILAPDCILA